MTVALRSTPSSNLPDPRTPLIGRARAVAAVRALLLREDVPLVTIVGPGGVGKTRLAIEVANGLTDDFPDGVHFVALAGVSDPGLVLFAIAQTLDAPQHGRGSPSAGLKTFLASRELLLVLDNFEHLLDAGADLGELIVAAPRLKVMATSRSILRLSNEQRFPLAPLDLPDPAYPLSLTDPEQISSVALFVQRAQLANPDFALNEHNAAAIGRICAELDGLPLAIELVVPHLQVLSPQSLLARLSNRLDLLTGGSRDRPMRLQTMRNAIAWSYEALDPAVRTSFRQLSVFAGGFTLDAAEHVLDSAPGQAMTREAVLDVLGALLDQSLIVVSRQPDREPRFWMLQTICEFAARQLDAQGEGIELRRRHALYFMNLVEQADAKLRGGEQATWLTLLDPEIDNVRAALTWTTTDGNGLDIALRIAGAMVWFWHLRGHHGEGRRWLEAVLALPAATAPMAARTYAVIGLGMLSLLLGDTIAARTELLRGIAAGRELDNWFLVACGMHHLGMLDLLYEGDFRAAAAALDESLALFRRVNDRWCSAVALCSVGILRCATVDLVGAQAVLEKSLALSREIGDRWNLGRVLEYLGEVARAGGEDDRARDYYEESLQLFRELGDPIQIASLLHNLGYVELHQGEFVRAAQQFAECLTLGWDRGANRVVAYCLMGLAGPIGLLGEPERAVRLMGAAEAQFEHSSATFWPIDRAEHERTAATIRGVMGDAAFDAARRAGRAVSLQAAMHEASAAISTIERNIAISARPGPPPEPLTVRERDVLRLLVEGYSNPEIADRLFISRKTASKHVTSILAKLDVESRTAAATQALRRGLV